MSERTLLIIAIAVVAATIGLFVFAHKAPSVASEQSIADEAEALPYDDPFKLGEYYFNHDPDMKTGQYDLKKARQYYNLSITNDPNTNVWAWYQLGRIDFIEGKFDAALYKFEKYKERVPEPRSADYMVGLVYGYKAKESNDPKDWQRAADAFLNFVELVPTEWAPRVDLSWVYFAQGKYEAMLPLLKEGIEHNEKNPWINNMYGLALLNTGDPQAALEHFTIAKEESEKMTEADWSMAYPGNDPRLWGDGLTEFQTVVSKNVVTAQAALAGSRE